ncbi:hypothetical protein ACQ4M3_24285 [Leptolyngbya sp. AN03gr2]|uniref:hypothetical protein n=1 Tax=unclassified Leptolyngbya TaxID=2650499 RepID=UPI003D31D158
MINLTWNHGVFSFPISIALETAQAEATVIGLLQSYDQFQIKHQIFGLSVGQAIDRFNPVRRVQGNLTAQTQPLPTPESQPQLKIWHIPQVPMPAFEWHVANLLEAKQLLQVLAEYDQWLEREGLKPDYSNAAGLLYWEPTSEEWLDWTNDWDLSIDEIPTDVLQSQSYAEIFRDYNNLRLVS